MGRARDTYEEKYYDDNGLPRLVNEPFPGGYASAVDMRQKKYAAWHAYAAHSPLCHSMALKEYVSRQSSMGKRNRLPHVGDYLLKQIYSRTNFTFEASLASL